MTDVKAIREALEKIGALDVPEDAQLNSETRFVFMLTQAFVTEGLKVCQFAEGYDHGPYAGSVNWGKLDLIASILKSAGRLQ